MTAPRSFDRYSDGELVDLCNGGGRREAIHAFEALYRRHRDYVTRVSLRFGADHGIAGDVLQETFLYLLKKFPPTGDGLVLSAQLRSLLYPVAKSLTLSALRRRERFEGSDVLDPDRHAETRGAGPEDGDLARLLSGLTSLSIEHREVLLLRFVDDLSLNEISEVLSIPLGTVKSRLHLAVKKLKSHPRIKRLKKS